MVKAVDFESVYWLEHTSQPKGEESLVRGQVHAFEHSRDKGVEGRVRVWMAVVEMETQEATTELGVFLGAELAGNLRDR